MTDQEFKDIEKRLELYEDYPYDEFVEEEIADLESNLIYKDIPKLLNHVRKMKNLLIQCEEHCFCTRNTVGFDYRETHRKLGKPEQGFRWLTPSDIINRFLEKRK